MITHYDVLGVGRDASPEQVKAAFRAAARTAHPDAGASNATLFVLVKSAYDVLSDPVTRAAYDRELANADTAGSLAPEPAPAPPSSTVRTPRAGATAGATSTSGRRPSFFVSPEEMKKAAKERRAEEHREQARQRAAARAAFDEEYRKKPFRPIESQFLTSWMLIGAFVGHLLATGSWWPGLAGLGWGLAAVVVTARAVLRPVMYRRARRKAPSTVEAVLTGALFTATAAAAAAAVAEPDLVTSTGAAAVVAVVGGYVLWAGWLADRSGDVYRDQPADDHG